MLLYCYLVIRIKSMGVIQCSGKFTASGNRADTENLPRQLHTRGRRWCDGGGGAQQCDCGSANLCCEPVAV